MERLNEFGLPVLLIGFNRPDSFARVADAVLARHPSAVYVSLDGPRPGRDDDVAAHEQLLLVVAQRQHRATIILRTSPENRGAGGHVTSAIDWFFEHEEFGAILEDDCVPSSSFFDFVRRMHGERPIGVTHLGGFTPAPPRLLTAGTSHFSRFPMTWGWATWREQWHGYRNALGAGWRERLPESRLREIGGDLPWFVTFWSKRFDELADGSRQVWDYQWVYWTWVHGGLSVTPNVNLVQNVGFGARSTHSYFARRAYRVPAVTLPPAAWAEGFADPEQAHRADRHLHVHFYKVNELWPVTATARGLARALVNRVAR